MQMTTKALLHDKIEVTISNTFFFCCTRHGRSNNNVMKMATKALLHFKIQATISNTNLLHQERRGRHGKKCDINGY